MNAWTHLVTDERELAGINPGIVEQARVRAAEKGVQGWLFALEQPTYVAVMTDADSETLRRTFYEAWSTRASDRGPNAGKFDNTEVMAKILALRHEAARLLDFPNYAAYALATRMAPSNQAVFDFLRQLARVARPPRKPNSPSSKHSPVASSMPGTSVTTPRSCSRSCFPFPRKSCGPISRCRACSRDCFRSRSSCSA